VRNPLHSPTNIARNNGWDALMPDYLIAKRLEDFIISTADALFAPAATRSQRGSAWPGSELSQSSARSANSRDQRPGQSGRGSICYFGRLDREGVINRWTPPLPWRVSTRRRNSNSSAPIFRIPAN
jgi:hypothetical protein